MHFYNVYKKIDFILNIELIIVQTQNSRNSKIRQGVEFPLLYLTAFCENVF